MTRSEEYYALIIRGERKIYQVPKKYRSEVIQLLKSNGYKDLIY